MTQTVKSLPAMLETQQVSNKLAILRKNENGINREIWPILERKHVTYLFEDDIFVELLHFTLIFSAEEEHLEIGARCNSGQMSL